MAHIKHPAEQTTILMKQYHLGIKISGPGTKLHHHPTSSSSLLKTRDKGRGAEKQRVFGWPQLRQGESFSLALLR